MKDELGEKIMTEFVALRGKMYAYRKIDKEVEEKRCKGTKKCAVSEGLTFDDYNTCLFDGETIYREQLFENKKHEVHTVNKYKIALNRDDDKRIAQADGITTLARLYSAFGLNYPSRMFFIIIERLRKIFTQSVYILCRNREKICATASERKYAADIFLC